MAWGWDRGGLGTSCGMEFLTSREAVFTPFEAAVHNVFISGGAFKIIFLAENLLLVGEVLPAQWHCSSLGWKFT